MTIMHPFLPLFVVGLSMSCEIALPPVSVAVNASNQSFTVMATDTLHWDTVINAGSFASYASLEAKWNYLYPWGKDHNGSARMYASPTDHRQLSLLEGNVLRIEADYINPGEGKSSSPPYEEIKYHSAALHAKEKLKVSEEWPRYEISGAFKAPVTKGSWPAFWITSADRWPPESDILEYKGDAVNWQNTFITPKAVTTVKTIIADAATNWHVYKAVLQKVNATDVDINYYIDDKPAAVHRCNFMNEPMWIIINLQMEGSSGSPGPAGKTSYYIKDVLVRRAHTQ